MKGGENHIMRRVSDAVWIVVKDAISLVDGVSVLLQSGWIV